MIAQALAWLLAWVIVFIGHRPHKALPSSALLEKHPVRRVGGAEGAAENRARDAAAFHGLLQRRR
jgi:hypothetical protein